MPTYRVPDDFQRQIEAWEVEEWETPFVCDECWVFQWGGNLSNTSDETRLICIDCSWSESARKEMVSGNVNKIVEGAKSTRG